MGPYRLCRELKYGPRSETSLLWCCNGLVRIPKQGPRVGTVGSIDFGARVLWISDAFVRKFSGQERSELHHYQSYGRILQIQLWYHIPQTYLT